MLFKLISQLVIWIVIAAIGLYQAYDTEKPIWLVVFIIYALLAITEYRKIKNVRED